MKDKHIIFGALIILLLVNVASAGFFSDLVSSLQNKPATDRPESEFKALYADISATNTNANINLINSYMTAQHINVAKIHVTDYNKDFYVLRGAGTTLEIPNHINKEISLSSSQLREIIGFLSDEKISWWEQFQLWSYSRYR